MIAGWPCSNLLPPPMQIRWRRRSSRWSYWKATCGQSGKFGQGWERGSTEGYIHGGMESNGSPSDLWRAQHFRGSAL